jgi:hypothetical protein
VELRLGNHHHRRTHYTFADPPWPDGVSLEWAEVSDREAVLGA